MDKQNYFGEIFQSSSTTWLGATWKWDLYPPLGSIIIIEHDAYLLASCISSIQTASSEQNRTAQPLQKTADELARDYPHLESLLQTTITGTPLGYIHNKKYLPQLSPYIPRIHAFMRSATSEECQKILQTNNPFGLLASFHTPTCIDTLILAILQRYWEQQTPKEIEIEQVLQCFTRIAGQDYLRIHQFVSAMETLLPQGNHV